MCPGTDQIRASALCRAQGFPASASDVAADPGSERAQRPCVKQSVLALISCSNGFIGQAEHSLHHLRGTFLAGSGRYAHRGILPAIKKQMCLQPLKILQSSKIEMRLLYTPNPQDDDKSRYGGTCSSHSSARTTQRSRQPGQWLGTLVRGDAMCALTISGRHLLASHFSLQNAGNMSRLERSTSGEMSKRRGGRFTNLFRSRGKDPGTASLSQHVQASHDGALFCQSYLWP